MTNASKKSSALDDLFRLYGELSDEDRRLLDASGGRIDRLAGADELRKQEWGYKCTRCGGVGLVFRGTQFRDAQGAVKAQVPLNLPLRELPWTQDRLPADMVDRAKPLCQECRQPLALEIGGRPRRDRIISLHDLAASRDPQSKEFQTIQDIMAAAKVNQQRGEAGGTAGENLIRTDRGIVTNLHPDDRAALDAYSEATGVSQVGPQIQRA